MFHRLHPIFQIFPTILFLLLILSLSCGSHEKSKLILNIDHFSADGYSGGNFRYRRNDGAPSLFSDLQIRDDNHAIKIIRTRTSDSELYVFFRSTGKPGHVEIRTLDGVTKEIHFISSITDFDGDGFPDAVELTDNRDRNTFRKWFIAVALAQFQNRSAAWVRKQRDCSGLIRYSYREALKHHTARWRKKNGISLDLFLPDVRKYNYPDVPVLGENIFKINGFPADHPNSFHVFAEAERIMNYHTRFVSRDIRESESGDLIFFEDKNNWNSPYHSMILVRNDENQLFLLYHTGTDDLMKLVKPEYLDANPVFRPREDNPSFMGVYRFKILEQ